MLWKRTVLGCRWGGSHVSASWRCLGSGCTTLPRGNYSHHLPAVHGARGHPQCALPCPFCPLGFWRRARRSAGVRAIVPVPIASFLLNEKRSDITAIEARNGVRIMIVPNPNMRQPHFEVVRVGAMIRWMRSIPGKPRGGGRACSCSTEDGYEAPPIPEAQDAIVLVRGAPHRQRAQTQVCATPSASVATPAPRAAS